MAGIMDKSGGSDNLCLLGLIQRGLTINLAHGDHSWGGGGQVKGWGSQSEGSHQPKTPGLNSPPIIKHLNTPQRSNRFGRLINSDWSSLLLKYIPIEGRSCWYNVFYGCSFTHQSQHPTHYIMNISVPFLPTRIWCLRKLKYDNG